MIGTTIMGGLRTYPLVVPWPTVLAVGVGAGLVAMYVARVLIQRTPLLPEASRRVVMRRGPRAAGDPG